MHDAIVVQVLEGQDSLSKVEPSQLQRQRPDVLQQCRTVPAWDGGTWGDTAVCITASPTTIQHIRGGHRAPTQM